MDIWDLVLLCLAGTVLGLGSRQCGIDHQQEVTASEWCRINHAKYAAHDDNLEVIYCNSSTERVMLVKQRDGTYTVAKLDR